MCSLLGPPSPSLPLCQAPARVLIGDPSLMPPSQTAAPFPLSLPLTGCYSARRRSVCCLRGPPRHVHVQRLQSQYCRCKEFGAGACCWVQAARCFLGYCPTIPGGRLPLHRPASHHLLGRSSSQWEGKEGGQGMPLLLRAQLEAALIHSLTMCLLGLFNILESVLDTGDSAVSKTEMPCHCEGGSCWWGRERNRMKHHIYAGW